MANVSSVRARFAGNPSGGVAPPDRGSSGRGGGGDILSSDSQFTVLGNFFNILLFTSDRRFPLPLPLASLTADLVQAVDEGHDGDV